MSRKSKKKKKEHSLYHQPVSNPLGFPSSRSIQATRVYYSQLQTLPPYTCLQTLVQHRRGGHMTLYHQDPVATLSRPSEGASQVGAP